MYEIKSFKYLRMSSNDRPNKQQIQCSPVNTKDIVMQSNWYIVQDHFNYQGNRLQKMHSDVPELN